MRASGDGRQGVGVGVGVARASVMAWVAWGAALLALGPGLMAGSRAMAQGGDEPAWAADTFCFPGVDGGRSTLDNLVWDACIYDDGTGPALYITGDFTIAGCARTTNVARWDGQKWSALQGLDGEGVSNGRGGEGGRALAVFDDGTGPALYVGGVFLTAGGRPASNIARWDGTDWSTLEGPEGEGLTQESPLIAVRDLAVFDDGTGPALYAGGTFRAAGGRPATRIAKWDGTDWSPLAGPMGEGVSGEGNRVRAMAVYDDGTGSQLYVAGTFDSAGGRDINRVARWDGVDWSDVGGWQGDGQSLALAAYDDGTGRALYMGGSFDVDGAFNDLVRWNGTAWEDLGISADGEIAALEVVDDDGVRPALYLGGNFRFLSGQLVESMARYDGAEWTSVGAGVEPGLGGTVRILLELDGNPGGGLFVGGWFQEATDTQMQSIARWDFERYRAFGNAPLGPTYAMTGFDDGSGEALFIGGGFLSAGDVVAERVARFDGEAFTPVGGGLGSFVDELSVYDDGSEQRLIALAGRDVWQLDTAMDLWQRWIVSDTRTGSGVRSQAAHDDGSGQALYVGGTFQFIGISGSPLLDIPSLVRVNSGEIEAVDWPYSSGPMNLASVRTGDRTDLYASGFYDDPSGGFLYYITRWDGSSWQPLIAPIQGGSYQHLIGFDDGSGGALYATGNFDGILGPTASRLARWDGTSWEDVGQSLGDGAVVDFAIHDDGSGPALYATGNFTGDAGELNRIAKWDGLAWLPLADDRGEGLDDTGRVIASVQHAEGPALYVGGDFRIAGGVGSSGLAKWAVEPVPCRADLDGDGTLTIFDFLAYQNLFQDGDLTADFDGDGVLTIFDFLAFQNEFDAGCS